jgi:DNA alkylation repair enzyme
MVEAAQTLVAETPRLSKADSNQINETEAKSLSACQRLRIRRSARLEECGGSFRGGSSRTLAICTMLIKDRDDMVVKALSWALRELFKRDPKSVREFMIENKDALTPRVVREVNNKMTFGLKNVSRSAR